MNREQLLQAPLVAVFAVARPDGRIHATPLWYMWDGTAFHLTVQRDSPRHRWSMSSGRAALCIETTEGDGRSFITAEGPVIVAGAWSYEDRLGMWTHYRGLERAHQAVDKGGHESMVHLILQPEVWIPG